MHALALLFLLPLTFADDTTTQVSTITLQSSVTSTILPANVAATTSGLSPQYTDATTFQSSILNSTNYWRYLYSAPFLSFNSSLQSYSQSYSEKCHWEHNPDLPKSHLGENLAQGYGDIIGAVDAWGNESLKFDFGSESQGRSTGKGGYTGWSEETGHFSQLVWMGTRSVGCGWTACNGKNGLDGVLLVCNYYPAGNVLGPKGQENEFFVQNVVPERDEGAQGYNETAGALGVGGPSQTAPPSSATSEGAAAVVRVSEIGGSLGLMALVSVVGAFVVGITLL